MISDISKIKENINNLNLLIEKLRMMLVNQNLIRLEKIEKENNKLYTRIDYIGKAYSLIHDIKDYLTDEIPQELYNKYLQIIYPDGNDIQFGPEIEIETDFLNRIHIPVGLPQILKNIGLGKQIYRKIIYKIGHISTLKMDQSLDPIFIWDSLRKDKDIYSFLREEQMLCINPALSFEEIKDILLIFFKVEIENEKNRI